MSVDANSAVDVNLTAVGRTVNNSTLFAAFVADGVAEQGPLIGLAIGLSIAIGLLIGLVFLVLGVIPRVLKNVKRIR